MLSEHLSSVDGVSIYPVISLIVFFVMFLFTIFWVLRLDKKYISRMENLPLDINSESENNSEIKNEIEK